MRAFEIMVYRQIKRFLRARSRVAGMIINPLVWLTFFGIGWSRAFRDPSIFGGVDYLTYLSPGIFAMTVFNQSFVSGISVIWDREFGFLKEVLVAPASRKETIAGRIFGDSAVATLQGAIILALTFFIARINIFGVIPALGVGFVLAVAFSSFGVSIAARMRSMEGFQMIMALVMLPLIFLSGAIYPIAFMPAWMKVLALLNPLTYAVESSRVLLTGVSGIFPLDQSLLILLSLTALMLYVAMVSFERSTVE
ncbi:MULTISPECIES: ABC transporter permease [Archaeoglobus]|jgi:ABC-2 type transport system permease protein|uniref:Daunorubicin resistance membrane protein (DrrB) n=3 Tax=Archaeoglobus fulgidus TaxID=2234 RepID=O28396_ARCFU|nr:MULTISPECIES: ABC transporter permease [Archaeoglobus]AAB89369.1 daunorubicin resistance membrane protein (drrB) [Archaeoglobus fulgidus DSM 4304]AIG98878.1 daunorubicin resistance ABC transporter membrane protein [Archaeoglobus fulgidus DSM 8774]KUJ93966.1 MAG: Daunorubicin resistance membrane protein (DrrB) [Archaeoglobus fulgidus]KUK07407.1 MAG: Daunorubicin resistance membrane protein (DrrB) [Archaeoglobus fulgidus]MDI3497762.1 type transport system permease protein [Archaeoglobus sp.]